MILLFDAESSGLWRPSLAVDDPNQPRLLQIAAKLVDAQQRRVMRWTAIIRPEGWSIEPDALKAHGITERRAFQSGIALADALRPLRVMAPLAKRIVGHGIQNFDRMLIAGELARLKADGRWWNARGADFDDTTEMSTEICQLPGQFGHKYPSLQEAMDFFFPAEPPHKTVHDAEADLEDTQRLYFAIKERLANPASPVVLR